MDLLNFVKRLIAFPLLVLFLAISVLLWLFTSPDSKAFNWFIDHVDEPYTNWAEKEIRL